MASSYSFNGQRKDESVKLVIKASPQIFLKPGIKTIVLIAIITAISFNFSGIYTFAADSLLVLFAAAIVVEAFLRYRISLAMVTNQRVIIVDKRGLLDQEISVVELNKIQDMSTVKKGIVKLLLRCGDVFIRTNNSQSADKITIKNVVDPYTIQQQIAVLIDANAR